MEEIRLTAISTGRGQGLRQFFVCEFCTFKLCKQAFWPKKTIYVRCPYCKTRYWYSKPCLRSGITVIVMRSRVITVVLYCVLVRLHLRGEFVQFVKCTTSGLLYPLNCFSSIRTLIGYLNLYFGFA